MFLFVFIHIPASKPIIFIFVVAARQIIDFLFVFGVRRAAQKGRREDYTERIKHGGQLRLPDVYTTHLVFLSTRN